MSSTRSVVGILAERKHEIFLLPASSHLMRCAVLALTAMLPALAALVQPAQAENRMWVAVDDAQRRSCPSMECGIVGKLFFRETVVVYDTSKGWSRVSGYSNAGCYEGKSSFVQSGRDDCSEENGISDGKFAVWVRSDSLADQKPAR